MQRFTPPVFARIWIVAAISLWIAGCALPRPAEPPAVIHENAHSGGSVVSFSEGGDLLASGGWEGTVRLWRMPGGAQQRHWRDHTDSVNGIAFIGDDSQVIPSRRSTRRTAPRVFRAGSENNSAGRCRRSTL